MSFEVHSYNDDVAEESRPTIRLVATECQSLFAEEVINNISISTCIRRAEHRFLLWASFLGVYADEQRCLDIRLQNSPEMRNLIMLMLRVLKRNLEHVIAEPYEIRHDDTKGPVYGIDGALDRLHRLATIIQSEQSTNEKRYVPRLNSKRILDGLDETVMTFLQKHFPDAPLSLQLQLSRSVLRRTKFLLYSRQQLRATGQSDLGDRISMMNFEAEAGSVNPLHASDREPSASLNQRVAKLHNDTNQGVSSILQGLNLYPAPPCLDGGDEEVICELCSAVLDKATIDSQEAWSKHVDRDLRPYVCISEECEQTELMFPTPIEWRFHMEAVHSMEWPRYVHQARWTCPYCQQDSVERTFTSAEEFSRHLRESNTSPHFRSVDSFELAKLTVECKRYEPIDKGDCPLCQSYVKRDGHDEFEDFYDHFIQHLRFVAFKAIGIWNTQTIAKLNQYASTEDTERRPDQLFDDEDKIHIDSPSPDLPNDTLRDHFRAEMDRVSIRGVDGNDQVVAYVPLSALEKYWTDERVIEILKTRAIQIPEGARFIYQGYLRIFSTLVYSGFCDEISWFFYRNTSKVDDQDLPFDGSTFGHTSAWSSSFLDHQWMFCPVELTNRYCHQQALDLRVILPVTYGEYIKANRTRPDGAILRKVDFNRVGFDSYLSMGEHVIFKVYEGDKGEERYNAEIDAYIRLQKLSNDSIAKYFASFYFPEVRKFVIVLEYAEGGSLTDYLEANPPPTTPEDALLLWRPMFNLTEALDLLTTIYQQNPRSQTFVGVHQEINPENILVFPRGKGTSRFDVQLKFKDFGMAASGAMSASDRRLRLGNRCNGSYVSPELFNFAIHGNSVAAISRLADIWSLGALFSDFLVWTITGTDGQDEYRSERRAEVLQTQQSGNPGYDCRFHDGEKRLKAIDDVHIEALECRGNGDFISPAISDLILDYMLVEPRDRLDAIQLNQHATKKLKEYQESLYDDMLPIRNSLDIEPRHPWTQPHLVTQYGKGTPVGFVSDQNTLVNKIEFNMDTGLRRKFCTYVESKLVKGVNGHGETVAYVPGSDLENYWSQANVDDILDSHDWPIHESSTFILKKLCHIFSNLVYTGHTQQISWFCQHVRNLSDHHLPFSAQELPQNCTWPKDFLEHQWKFCPLAFTPDTVFKRTLYSKHILPVAYEECLTDTAQPSGAATLWRVRMQSECTLPLSKAGTVVFKVYEGASAQRLYKAEAEAYNQLLRFNNEGYITKHFASFSFDDIEKSIIVLEYAEGGSLLNFLENINIPFNLDDYCLLWSRLLNLFDALHALHDICRSATSGHWSLPGVHQDIQLSNILVFPAKNKSSRFDVNFKLADFGLAKIGRISSPESSLITSQKGNRIYTSPETYRNYDVQDWAMTEISTFCDIWSLGAVFSDVLVWSITGERGREDYRLRRQEEISNKAHLRVKKHDACFHDGISRLTAVDEFHNYVLQHKRLSDHISPYMSLIIIEFLLTERLGRLSPMQAKIRADRHIQMVMNGHEPRPNHLRDISPSRLSYPKEKRYAYPRWDPPPNLPTQHEPLTKHLVPEPVSTLVNHNEPIAEAVPISSVVTVDQVYQLLEQKDRLLLFSSSLGAKADKGAEIMDLPGMQEARSKISETKGRDQIMLVDNFGSMESHKPKAMRTARVISYVAKIADYNGMEVFAASETTERPVICNSSGKVEKVIKKMETVKGRCNMHKCLDDVLDRVLVPEHFRPTSIYIYTDGVWEPGDDQVKLLISRAIDFLDRHEYKSSALMFQFIRFGNDPTGTVRLNYLANQCKRQTAVDLYDIVDAKDCDEHVPDIVIGSISRWGNSRLR